MFENHRKYHSYSDYFANTEYPSAVLYQFKYYLLKDLNLFLFMNVNKLVKNKTISKNKI